VEVLGRVWFVGVPVSNNLFGGGVDELKQLEEVKQLLSLSK